MPSPQRSQPSIVVPNIEEELSFLTEGEFSFTSDSNTSVRKSLAPNPNGDYHLTYLKFLEGNQYISSPINPRPVKRSTITKRKQSTEQVNDEVLDNDSDEDLGSTQKQDGDNDEKKVEDVLNRSKGEEVLKSANERRPSAEEKNKGAESNGSKADNNNSGSFEKLRTSRRKAANKHFTNNDDDDEDDKEVPELRTSDSDPVWEPADHEEKDRRRSSRLKHSKRKILKDNSSPSSDEEDFQPKKRKNTGKKKPPIKKPEVSVTPSTEPKIKVVSPSKIMNFHPAYQNKSNTFIHASFPFNVGDFIVATVDLAYYYPPLWRVKENHMLQKFLHSVKSGLVHYSNVPTFTAWSPGSKYIYEAVEVKFVTQIKRDVTVKLISRNRHKITSGIDIFESSMEETKKYQEFFVIYIQALISHSLNRTFLPEILREKDDYFLSNIRVIDEYCQELIDKLIAALKWRKEFCTAICKLPTYISKVCGESCICSRSAEVKISLEGTPYNPLTLIALEENVMSSDAALCLKCFDLFQILHKVCHFKLYTYAICDEKVNCKKTEKPNETSTAILNGLLADNQWIDELFADASKLWSYIEKIVVELNKQASEETS
ncbi:hypothetical protein O3M35_006314 [Rhynocoris fuscipes]